MNRVPPQALDLEKAVLGAILLEREAIHNVIEILRPEMFYHIRHQVVYETALDMQMSGKQIDLRLLIEQLQSKKQIEEAGGVAYVVSLTDSVVSSYHTEKHARKIAEKYLLREQIRIGSELVSKAYAEEDPFENLEWAEKQLHDLAQTLNQEDAKRIDTVLVSVVQEIEEQRHRTEALTGITTGYKTLDKLTMGWHATDLSIIAARPAVGKTAYTLSLAINAALHGVPVVFFSLEMGAEQLVKRVLASQAKIFLSKLRSAKLDDQEMNYLFKNGVQPLAGLPFYIDDTASMTVGQFKAKLRRLVRTRGVKACFVDYLQLLKSSLGKNTNRQQQIGDISRELKIAAKELKIPIVALSQLSREVEKRTSGVPQLSDLREAGDIEQDADNVLFLYGHSEKDILSNRDLENAIYLKIAKQRNGSLANIGFHFDKSYQSFTDMGEASESYKSIEDPF
jgi:replicative DNA helicase